MTSNFKNFNISVSDEYFSVNTIPPSESSKISKNRYELLKILDWQISLLKDACVLFDEGKEYQSLTMATIIRLLIHDSRNTKSLFKQLDLKKLEFISAKIVPSEKHKSWGSMYMINRNHEKKILEANSRFKIRGYYDSLHPNSDYHRVTFEQWWTEIIEVHYPLEHSRKDYILDIADKDGGAHVDDTSSHLGYSHLVKKSSYVKVGNDFYYSENTHFTIIRQIAFELLQTINEIIIPYLENKYKDFDFVNDIMVNTTKMYALEFENEQKVKGN